MNSIPITCLRVRGNDVMFISSKELSMMIKLPFFMSVDLLYWLSSSCIWELIIHIFVVKIPWSCNHLIKNMICLYHCALVSIEFNELINTDGNLWVIIMHCIVMHCESLLEVIVFVFSWDLTHRHIWMSIPIISTKEVLKTDLTFSILIKSSKSL